jgi:outer membrane lipoprotein LolB
VAAALAAAGCAEVAYVRPAPDLQFEIAGRIAVKYRDEAASANLAWRHGALGDELIITSQLGQGVARLVREGAEVKLSTPERGEFRAADAESLTEKVLGFRLPLAGLADWVRARPAPGPARPRYDASGRLLELEQAGWRVQYLEYSGGRPVRLRLVYPGLELRLAISEWK